MVKGELEEKGQVEETSGEIEEENKVCRRDVCILKKDKEGRDDEQRQHLDDFRD